MPTEDTEDVVLAAPDGTATDPAPVKKKKKSAWRELPALVVGVVAFSLVIRMFFLQAFYIPSESMEKTLHGCAGCSGNDRVLVWKFGKHFGPPKRGDIVVFDGRGSFVTQNNEKDYIKRVIGVPGDNIRCCDCAAAARLRTRASRRTGRSRSAASSARPS